MVDVGTTTIQGKGDNRLEIEVEENGDISVMVSNGIRDKTYADFPSPLNGGGDEKAYRQLLAVCELLQNMEKE